MVSPPSLSSTSQQLLACLILVSLLTIFMYYWIITLNRFSHQFPAYTFSAACIASSSPVKLLNVGLSLRTLLDPLLGVLSL